MNDTACEQLQAVVERMLRPVQASARRKRAMQEELLAHLSAIFADEASSGGEETALQRTMQRFGDPAELSGQLRQSVSSADILQWFIGRALFSVGGYIGVLVGMALICPALAQYTQRGSLKADERLVLPLGALMVLAGFTTLVLRIHMQRVRRQ